MKEVEVSATIEVPRSKTAENVSPESIVEYSGAWRVTSSRTEGDDTVLTVTSDQFEETELRFSERPNGYSYTQLGTDGPFEYVVTDIEVAGDEAQTELTLRSEFTFGGRLSLVKNWFGTTLRRQELETLITNMAQDLSEERVESEEER